MPKLALQEPALLLKHVALSAMEILDVVHIQTPIAVLTMRIAVQMATSAIFPRVNVSNQQPSLADLSSQLFIKSKLQHQWLVQQEPAQLVKLVAILVVVNLDVVHTQMLIAVLIKPTAVQMATNAIFPRANVLRVP